MRRFAIKFLLISLPVLFLIGLYFYKDPFKVLYHYDSYYISGDSAYVAINQDYVSLQNLINKSPDYKYDSYIFGNSRSMNYRINSWTKYIHSTGCYHFDAFSESLYGVAKKLEFLEQHNMPVKNALIVMDYGLLKTVANTPDNYRKHPGLSGEGRLFFNLYYFRLFFDINFLRAYLRKLAGCKPDADMYQVLNDWVISYDPVTNEILGAKAEKLIAADKEQYYSSIATVFYERPKQQQYYSKVIDTAQSRLLQQIAGILKRRQADYRIVINPLYDQKKLNTTDLAKLGTIFGSARVFDFSGINRFTAEPTNYYEPEHYRPIVADAIMDSIYKQK
jgi:hypothetical protein